jgi:hypothetical protein
MTKVQEQCMSAVRDGDERRLLGSAVRGRMKK